MQLLTVGRIVHWRLKSKWVAAIVTRVPDLTSADNKAELYVFPSSELFPHPIGTGMLVTVDVGEDGTNANDGSWRWPPRS